MSKIFNYIARPKIKRSTFDRSHYKKLTAEMGKLVPILCEEVLPGDNFKIQSNLMVRFAPMVAPIMHRVNAHIHYFYVPNRLIWDDWEDFITGAEGLVVPTVDLKSIGKGIDEGHLADYLGIPPGNYSDGNTFNINTLPFRAYLKIFNDYYRDSNLVPDDIEKNDAGLVVSDCFFSAWEKDYFTTAFTSPQKGEVVQMDATIIHRDKARIVKTTDAVPAAGDLKAGAAIVGTNYKEVADAASGALKIESVEGVTIDVEELRKATRIQKYLERLKRTGGRYAEHLLGFWGVNPKDERLQRAEYLGGGKTSLIVNAVENTSDTTNAVQGQLSGNGTILGETNRASKFVEEHGFIIGIMKVLPETSYSQGIERMFLRELNLDYYFPDFANLGEQDIKKVELYFDKTKTEAENNETWGYQSRFAEYKYKQSTVHGAFRSNLSFWHMGRLFDKLPNLNVDFIMSNKGIDDEEKKWRVFAVLDTKEHMYVQVFNNVIATRPMPFLPEPSL